MLLRASRIASWKITVRHAHLQHLFYFMLDVRAASHWRSQGGRQARAPRNWVHKKIPGCAVELNTQNCAWFGSRISLITAMSFREDMPPEPPTRGSVPGPRWGTSVPQTPYAPHVQILATPLTVKDSMRKQTETYSTIKPHHSSHKLQNDVTC